MSKPPLAFMEKHGIESDEVWEVRTGVWAIKHSALERVAGEKKITFDRPAILQIDVANKIAAFCVFGTLGDRTEWATGEAAPYNNKNGYPAAMAEKRAKDRVTLKLLNAHGSIYSDAEAEDFAQSTNGKPAMLPKKDAKEMYAKMQREIQACQSREQLKTWMEGNKSRIEIMPEDWQDIMRLQCQEMMLDLKQREAA